jgi:hypothetical protein
VPQHREDRHTLGLDPTDRLVGGIEITGLVFEEADSLGVFGNEIKSGRTHVGAIDELISDAGSIPAASIFSTS